MAIGKGFLKNFLPLRISFAVILIIFITCPATSRPAAAAQNLLERVQEEDLEQTIRLRVGRSKVLRTPYPIQRISVADPDIADIVLISNREVYINGNAAGVTNVSIWGKQQFSSTKVSVEPDVSILKEKLFKILPREKIAVEAAGDTVVLSGEVSGPAIQETALALATPYAGGKKEKVVNLLHVGGVQQVMVEVKVAEINRSVGKEIGINFGWSAKNGASFGATLLNKLTSITNMQRNMTTVQTPGILANDAVGNTASISSLQGITSSINAVVGGVSGGLFWAAFFDLLKQQGLGKILAEPNLVATSGQEASFLAGGEYPIPVPSGLGTVSIEYKKYGVGLIFTPTVLDESKISMKINPEVSELDYSTAQTVTGGYYIPGLRVRRTSTTVEMKDGQTLALAGLLSDQHRTVVDKYPVLGDLPVLGTLFRSKNFQKKETELVILVTPHLVKNQPPGPHRLPTDKYVEPTDAEFYLLDRMEGRGNRRRCPTTSPSENAPLPEFGRSAE